jgi:diguanylate cyclase (GGDEF)-like protein
MPYARNKEFAESASHPRVVPLGVAPRVAGRAASMEVRREIDELREVNAQLQRELAILKQRESQAQRLADRDGLTGLYNRRRMCELLDTMISDATQHAEVIGLLFIDLNEFKSVNDQFGHAVGDKLLTTVASRIAGRARTGDIVCRYGGDEFVVLLPRVPDLAVATKVANKIRERVALPYLVDGHELHVSAAIGVAAYPADGVSADELLRRADESMYRDKKYCRSGARSAAKVPHARRRDDKSKLRTDW